MPRQQPFSNGHILNTAWDPFNPECQLTMDALHCTFCTRIWYNNRNIRDCENQAVTFRVTETTCTCSRPWRNVTAVAWRPCEWFSLRTRKTLSPSKTDLCRHPHRLKQWSKTSVIIIFDDGNCRDHCWWLWWQYLLLIWAHSYAWWANKVKDL